MFSAIGEDIWSIITNYTDPLTKFVLGLTSSKFTRYSNKYELTQYIFSTVQENSNTDFIMWLSELNFPLQTECTAIVAQTGNIEALKTLKKRGYAFNELAYICAAGNGYVDVLEWLLYNTNARPNSWALNSAIRYGHLDAVKFLLKHKKKYSCKYIGESGSIEIFDFLLEKTYVSMSSIDEILDGAVSKGHKDFVNYLCTRYKHLKVSELTAARAGHLRTFKEFYPEEEFHRYIFMKVLDGSHLRDFKWLVKHQVIPDDMDYEKALMRGSPEMKEWLISQGIKLVITRKAVLIAIEDGDLEFLRQHWEEIRLIAKDEDRYYNSFDEDCYSTSVENGRVAIFEYLMSQGIELSNKDYIMKAFSYKQPEMLEYLLSIGLDHKKPYKKYFLNEFETDFRTMLSYNDDFPRSVKYTSTYGYKFVTEWLEKNGRTIDSSYRKIEMDDRYNRIKKIVERM